MSPSGNVEEMARAAAERAEALARELDLDRLMRRVRSRASHLEAVNALYAYTDDPSLEIRRADGLEGLAREINELLRARQDAALGSKDWKGLLAEVEKFRRAWNANRTAARALAARLLGFARRMVPP